MNWMTQITDVFAASGQGIGNGLATFVTSLVGIALICAAIIIWALVAYFGAFRLGGFRRKIRPLIGQLDEACAQLKATTGETEFASRFHELDESFKDNPLIGDAWQEFQASLLFPEPEEPDQAISNPHPPGLYFRRDSLLGQKLNLRLYNALPNLFTGTGILGTFIGLVAGIYLASGNLASDDITQAQEAMQHLLHGASLAFLTSIVGLFSSIVFSWREKHWLHQFDERLGCWVDALDQRLRRKTLESIAGDQLLQARQQTTVLEGFTNQLAFQIAEALDTRLNESLAPPLKELVNGIHSMKPALDAMARETQTLRTGMVGQMTQLLEETKALRTDRQGSNENAMQQLVDTFTEKLQGATGQEIEALAKTLQTLNKSLLDQTERFEKSMGVLRDTLHEVREINTDTRAVVKHVGDVADGLGRAAEAVENLAGPIASASQRFEDAGGKVLQSVEQITAHGERLAEVHTDLRDIQSDLRASWQDYEQRFKGIDDALGNAFTKLDEGLSAYTRQVSDYLKELDAHTANISSVLGKAAQELGETIEEFNETMSRKV